MYKIFLLALNHFSQVPPKMARHRPLVPLPCHPISAMHEMMVPANGPLVSTTNITAVRSVKVTTPVSTVGGGGSFQVSRSHIQHVRLATPTQSKHQRH